MTTRQAVLASTIESAPLTPGKRLSSVDVFPQAEYSHVSIIVADENPPQAPTAKGKKKQLNENEIALRREETARKRRNLTEKKLEDEKVRDIYIYGHQRFLTLASNLGRDHQPSSQEAIQAKDQTSSSSSGRYCNRWTAYSCPVKVAGRHCCLQRWR
jgi:hypothetical protein